MATALQTQNKKSVQKDVRFATMKIGIVVSEWNSEITGALLEGALEYLVQAGVKKKNIIIQVVPGSFELPLGCQWLLKQKSIHAAIALGCVIQGETRHFDFICQAVAQGLMDLGLKSGKPAIFGVLTTDNLEQAQARSGGALGNKGSEAAETAIKMLLLKSESTFAKI